MVADAEAVTDFIPPRQGRPIRYSSGVHPSSRRRFFSPLCVCVCVLRPRETSFPCKSETVRNLHTHTHTQDTERRKDQERKSEVDKKRKEERVDFIFGCRLAQWNPADCRRLRHPKKSHLVIANISRDIFLVCASHEEKTIAEKNEQEFLSVQSPVASFQSEQRIHLNHTHRLSHALQRPTNRQRFALIEEIKYLGFVFCFAIFFFIYDNKLTTRQLSRKSEEKRGCLQLCYRRGVVRLVRVDGRQRGGMVD